MRYSYDVGIVGQEYFRCVFGLGFGWICIKIYKRYIKIYNCIIGDTVV